MKFMARVVAISALATVLLGAGTEMALAGTTAATGPTPTSTASSNDNSWQSVPNTATVTSPADNSWQNPTKAP